jgi:hypothetical protein
VTCFLKIRLALGISELESVSLFRSSNVASFLGLMPRGGVYIFFLFSPLQYLCNFPGCRPWLTHCGRPVSGCVRTLVVVNQTKQDVVEFFIDLFLPAHVAAPAVEEIHHTEGSGGYGYASFKREPYLETGNGRKTYAKASRDSFPDVIRAGLPFLLLSHLVLGMIIGLYECSMWNAQ